MSLEEFLLVVDPPGLTTELIEGNVVIRLPVSTWNGHIAAEIGAALIQFVDEHDLGFCTGSGGYILNRDPGTLRGPAVAYLSFERFGGRDLPETGYVEGAPNLAVEVVSPDDREQDVQRKIELWLGAGAERVWEIRPRLLAVTVHQRGESPRTLTAGATLTSDDAAFPVEGFRLLVGDIFK